MESRNLVFSDGSSNKFWKIELDGSSHTVTFGKIGTTGQSQTKSFDSNDAAKKAFDKLVAEKTKKGYVDADVPQETKSSKTPAVKKAIKPKQASQSEISDPKETSNESPTSSKPIAIDVCLNVERTIDLSATDWHRASFRKLPPLDRGAAREFDRDQAIQKIAKLKTTDYGWRLGWNALDLPDTLSTDEAHFWLIASTSVSNTKRKSSFLATAMSTEKITGKVSVKEASRTIHRMDGRIEEVTTRALANLFSPMEYLELMQSPPGSNRQSWQHALSIMRLVDGFNRHVVPYMTIPQREEIRNRIRKTWDPTIDPISHPASNYEGFPVEYYVAASIGMHDEVYSVVSRWSDDRYQKSEYLDQVHKPQELLFGLGSAQIIESEWRRLRLKMRTPADVRAFLACTEYAALDCVANDVVAQTNKDECEALLNAFTLVRAPEAAEPMLRCKLEAKIPAKARAWLDRNVGCAVEGLIETAGGKGKLAEAATEYLRGVKKRGFAQVVSSALKGRSNSASAVKVQTEVLDHEEKSYEPHDTASTPDWLAKELREATGQKRKSLPSWATPALLPPLIVGERRLNDQQVELVLQVLAATPLGTKHPLLTSVAENSSKLVRDEFAWKLFQLWQEDGSASKDKWAMGAMGHLGDDNCVLKLTPLIRVWPGESQHARAVFGLECLRAIGSSMALMNLSGIAQKLKFKGLKSKAEQFVAEIAKDRGLTREELEDRVVPDCGLDEKGRREFSFGPRSFSFILGGDLKAAIRDESGKIRSDLPAANSKDDEAQAKESIAEWKLMKKQIKDVATIQAGRLEQAMVTGRRWRVEDFEELLVKHPLMTHLAQKLIWAGYDVDGKRTLSFRVTEERDYANSDDDAVSLDGTALIGLVHPAELSNTERSQWGEVLSDYEVVSPFPQLGRAVYSLEKGEEKKESIDRFHGLKLVAPTLVFTLEKLGWVRGVAMDGGCFTEHSKQFRAANVTAVIDYDGVVGMGYIDPNETLTLQSINFCSGMRTPSGYGWDKQEKMLTLGEVPPIVASEVIADLHVLKSKSK